MAKKKTRHQKKSSQDIINDDDNNDSNNNNNEPQDEQTDNTTTANSINTNEDKVVEEKKEEKKEEDEKKEDEKQEEENQEEKKEEKKEEEKVENGEKKENMWSDEDEIDVPIVEGSNNEIPPEKFIIKQKKIIKVKKEKKVKPVKKVEPVPEPVQQQQQNSGWGGWFSSIGNAVSNTITQIARVDLDDTDEENEEEEEIVVEEEVELTREEYDKYMESKRRQEQEFDDEGNTLMDAVDNGIFKTADMIADSLYFAGSLLSSGFKSVQDNANMENVKNITQDVSQISSETKNKISNSELYGKASQMMDSSVDVLESVGQRAYSMFSTQLKLNKQQQPSSGNKSDIPNQQDDDNDNDNNNNNNNSNNNNNNNEQEDKQKSPLRQKNTTTVTTTPIKSTTLKNDEKDKEINMELSIFEEGEFDSMKSQEHYQISKFIQDIEKISVESTMKAHQINRKVISSSTYKSQVDQVLSEIKELFESDDIVPSINNNNGDSNSENKLTFSNIHVFELEKKYNKFFDKLQEYIPQLKSQSIELSLCRGLEKIYQLSALSLELISTIAESIPDEKPNQTNNQPSIDEIKDWSLEKSNQLLFLIAKCSQDIKVISSMLAEIVKSKQNPNSRKLLNNLHVETTNASSFIQDTKGSLTNICQIMYLNQIKNLIKGSSSPNTPIRKNNK